MTGQDRLPLVLVRSSVLFPGAALTLQISRPENLAALRLAPGLGALVIAAPLLDPESALEPASVSRTGCLARVLDRVPQVDGAERVVLEGLRRVELEAIARDGEALVARARELVSATTDHDQQARLQAHARAVLELAHELAERDPRTSAEIVRSLTRAEREPERFADLAAARLHLAYADAREVLDERAIERRLQLIERALRSLLARADLADGLRDKVQERLRHDFLREQLAVIQAELGLDDPVEREARELEARARKLELPTAARERLSRQIARLRRATPGSVEASRTRNWIEWVLELPWKVERDPRPIEFSRVREVLDQSHVGLEDVKQRVAEFLAVRALGGDARGAVLCFVGPPGTGKTTMAQVVAQALERRFVSISVGSLRDESELVGSQLAQPTAMPGCILQGLHRARSLKPVILLDELDKLAVGGKPGEAGALLSILDPDQNATFVDRYLGVPCDLSNCVFLATANDLAALPEALVDRLEVIRFGSYTDAEKLEIARSHLLTRARASAGLTRHQLRVSPAALAEVVRKYSEEAGVRQLARTLDTLARKAAMRVVDGLAGLDVKKSDLLELLGPPSADEQLHYKNPRIGVATALAWTSIGGATLSIEALSMPGAGRMVLTGSIGDVMRESVQTAISYVRAHLGELGLADDVFDTHDLHLHFPSGSTPKDGPSAGIAIAASLVSLWTRIPVRQDVAMTGEMTLHGAVLPVGGLREKLLAASRARMREVIMPARNSEELLRLPAEVRQRLRVHLVEHVHQALALALAFTGRSRLRSALAAKLGHRRAAVLAPGRASERRRNAGERSNGPRERTRACTLPPSARSLESS